MYTGNASERVRCSELSFRPVNLEVAYILFARSSSTFARLWVFLLFHILLLGILAIISFQVASSWRLSLRFINGLHVLPKIRLGSLAFFYPLWIDYHNRSAGMLDSRTLISQPLHKSDKLQPYSLT